MKKFIMKVKQLLIMTIKKIAFTILVLLITIDIVLTNFFVIFYGAIEINPLCINFLSFMIIKIIVSIGLLYITIQIKNVPFWTFFIIILISIYISLLYSNMNNIINFFFF